MFEPRTSIFTQEKVPNEYRFIRYNIVEQFSYFDTKEEKSHFGIPLDNTKDQFYSLKVEISTLLDIKTIDKTDKKIIGEIIENFYTNINQIYSAYQELISIDFSKLGYSKKDDFLERLKKTTNCLPSYMRFTEHHEVVISEIKVEDLDQKIFTPSHYKEAEEFIAKNLMMVELEKLYRTVQYNIDKNIAKETKEVMLWIQGKLDEIIDKNLSQLPLYETFYLFGAFVNKLTPYVKWFINNSANIGLEFQTKLDEIDKKETSYYEKTKELSESFYMILKTMYKTIESLFKESSDEIATEENANKIYNFLGILEVLNSPCNPFAQNGLFGSQVNTDFHVRALKALENFEAYRCSVDKATRLHIPSVMSNAKPAEIKQYNELQKNHLLYGSTTTQIVRSSLLSKFGRKPAPTSASFSRESQLRLPAPQFQTQKQLLLTSGANSNQNIGSRGFVKRPTFLSYDPNSLIGKFCAIAKKYRDSGQTSHLRVADYMDACVYYVQSTGKNPLYLVVLFLTVHQFLEEKGSTTFTKYIKEFAKENYNHDLYKDFVNNNKKENIQENPFELCKQDLDKYYNAKSEITDYNFPWMSKVTLTEASLSNSNVNTTSSTGSSNINIVEINDNNTQTGTQQNTSSTSTSPSSGFFASNSNSATNPASTEVRQGEESTKEGQFHDTTGSSFQ